MTFRAHASRYMTWDKALFPNPEKLQNNIASRGRKMVTIVDPHIKRDPAYPIFKAAEEKGYYVKNKDGKDYDGCVTRIAMTRAGTPQSHCRRLMSAVAASPCDKGGCGASMHVLSPGYGRGRQTQIHHPNYKVGQRLCWHAGGAGRARRRTWT